MSPLTPLRPRNLGVAIALVALALAACSKSTSTPSVLATPTPTPTANPSATATPAGCIAVPAGVAYIPDGGNGGSFSGVQVVHFEDSSANLCSTATVLTVPFSGPVGALAFASDASTALAAISINGGTTFTQIQDIFGVAGASLIPAGATYDVTQAPTPTPSTTPTPLGNVTLSDVNSIAIVGSGSTSVGLVGGQGPGILGITQLANAPPRFGGFVPFRGGTPDPGAGSRPIVVANSGPSLALTRGQADLLSYAIALVSTGYQFTLKAFDTTLGYGARNLRGGGLIALSPADTTRALVAGAAGTNSVTLVTGLPNAINKVATIALASRARSVAVAAGGAIGVVGADNGFYVITGVNTSTPVLGSAFAPNPSDATANALSFVGCDGRTYLLTNVSSIAFSEDQRYLVVVGTPPTQVCSNARNSSLVAIAFNTATGVPPTPTPSATPSAVPTMFTANGIVTRPTDTDYLLVR